MSEADNSGIPPIEEFSLVSEVRHIKLNGEDHIVVAANSETATSYRNLMMKYLRYSDNKVEGQLGGLAEAEPYLVSRCVFKPLPDGTRSGYTIEEVKGWPNKAVKGIHAIVMEISDLNEKADKTKKG